MQIDLTGKRAVVCGSSQGIGRACALELARLGATVILMARNEVVLHTVKKELRRSMGQSHEVLAVDFSDVEALEQNIQTYVKSAAPVHILVNNSGGPPAGAVFDAKPEEFVAAFSQHLLCNQTLTRAVVPGMKSEKYGRIINIISTSVKQPIKGLGVSNTIRGAVAHWAKTLAGELAPFGITVNNVLPGATKTARLQALIEDRAESTGQSTDRVAEEWKAAIPTGRFAEPEELAYAVAFLASPSASYINGINLPVDGGRTLCL
ncbi:MAG: SDR family oxidoreductase [bacterium]